MRALLTAMAILGVVLTCAFAASAHARHRHKHTHPAMYDHVESTLWAWVPVPIDAIDLRKT